MRSSPPTETDLARFSDRSGMPASVLYEGGGAGGKLPGPEDNGAEPLAAARLGPAAEAEPGAEGLWEEPWAEVAVRAEVGLAEEEAAALLRWERAAEEAPPSSLLRLKMMRRTCGGKRTGRGAR